MQVKNTVIGSQIRYRSHDIQRIPGQLHMQVKNTAIGSQMIQKLFLPGEMDGAKISVIAVSKHLGNLL